MKYHDLSSNFATIDYKILFEVVTIAVGLSKEQVYKEYSKIENDLFESFRTNNSLTGAVLSSERLIVASNDLNKALETYHTLRELGKNRDTLVIKNFGKEIISEANE